MAIDTIQHMQEQGYAIFRNVLDAELLAEANAHVD